MDSSLARKIQKANQYATERHRFHFESFEANFQGTHHSHKVRYTKEGFTCDCEYFTQHKYCSHTLALEKMLEPMVERVL